VSQKYHECKLQYEKVQALTCSKKSLRSRLSQRVGLARKVSEILHQQAPSPFGSSTNVLVIHVSRGEQRHRRFSCWMLWEKAAESGGR